MSRVYTLEQRLKYIANATKWNKENPERSKASARRSILKKRTILTQAKSRPCMDCKIQYPSWVMEFDHRIPSQKINKVSRVEGFSINRLITEINKCDIVCANCHAERTHKQCLERLIKPYGGLGNGRP